MKQLNRLHNQPIHEEDLHLHLVYIRKNIVNVVRKLCHHIDSANLVKAEQRSALHEFLEADSTFSVHFGSNNISSLHRQNSISEDFDGRDVNINLLRSRYYFFESIVCDMEWIQKVTHEQASTSANLDSMLFMRHWKALKTIWESSEVTKLWESSLSSTNVIDNHAYFLNNMESIASVDYVPSLSDYFISRKKTLLPVSKTYTLDNDHQQIELIDVGGQRNIRRTWKSVIQEGRIDAVVFVASLSEYDQRLSESRNRVNRMSESIELFHQIRKHISFEHTPIFLVLNKKDLLQDKITRNHIQDQAEFKHYTGKAGDLKQAIIYFKKMYIRKLHSGKDVTNSYVHVISALDLDEICKLFQAVQNEVQ